MFSEGFKGHPSFLGLQDVGASGSEFRGLGDPKACKIMGLILGLGFRISGSEGS